MKLAAVVLVLAMQIPANTKPSQWLIDTRHTFDLGWTPKSEMVGGIGLVSRSASVAYICPKHGPLDRDGFVAAVRITDRNFCASRPICFFCLAEAAEHIGPGVLEVP